MSTKRIRGYGICPGRMEPGERNKITDVPGVLVGHCTIKNDKNHTGVTVILPGPGNSFTEKYTAAAYVHNGFGKSAGLIQIGELGTLETPIALTNTLNVGLVWDAVAGYVLEQCEKDGVLAASINPVVGECNDSRINHIRERAVKEEHVRRAIEDAAAEFEEGDVGAGTGTVCYGLKGGIGSASRLVEIAGKTYTVGVLVQSNFGATADFVLDGKAAGEKILAMKEEKDRMAEAEQDQGSIMTILATDLPVSSRQLGRIIRRAGVGIARTGSYTGHGSGEIMIGFTTANRVTAGGEDRLRTITMIPEDTINRAFQAAAEATHEAILNSMVCAAAARGIGGEVYYGLAEFLPRIMEDDKLF